MRNICNVLFLISLFLIINSIIIYPLAITILSVFKRKLNIYGKAPKSVSVLLSVYNGEDFIKNKIENICFLEQDDFSLEILVGSDGSVDRTNEILAECEKKFPELKVRYFEMRKGKASVLNELCKEAKGEILLFTDLHAIFSKNAAKEILTEFIDKEVGGTSGRLIYIESEKMSRESIEETKYWFLETQVKHAEGKLGILLGGTGAIFAIRKNFLSQIPTAKAVTDDLYLSLKVVSAGKRFTYCYNATAEIYLSRNLHVDYKRKVRTASTNFQTIMFFKNLLFNERILLSYSFWSHKIIRWFFPLILLTIFTTNVFIIRIHSYYEFLFYIQVGFYSLVILGYFLSLISVRIWLFSIPFFFIFANVALANGFIKFLKGEHSAIWEPTKR